MNICKVRETHTARSSSPPLMRRGSVLHLCEAGRVRMFCLALAQSKKNPYWRTVRRNGQSDSLEMD